MNSYIAHHSYPLRVYGLPGDLEHIPQNRLVDRVVPTIDRDGSTANSIEERYSRGGHEGTAHFWAGLIRSNPGRIMIHIDSDQIFVGDAVGDVVLSLAEGSDVAGPRRPYRLNANRRQDLHHLPDAVATFCFGFRSSALPRWPRWLLERAIAGRRISYQRPLDFFDPVTLALLRKGRRVAYLDSPADGSSSSVAQNSPFLSKIISMPSAAATGCALERRGISSGRNPYEIHALESWRFFKWKLLGGEPLVTPPHYTELETRLRHLDDKRWCLS